MNPAAAASTAGSLTARPRFGIGKQHLPLVATIVVWAILYAVACFSFDGFFSARVFVNFISENSYLGVAAVGVTFVILSGGIDLSVGAVIALTGILIATLVQGTGPLPAMHPAIAIVVALVLGTLFGTAQGALIRFFNLPAFLITLGGMYFCRGTALLISEKSMSIGHVFLTTTLPDLAIPLGDRLQLPLTGTVFLVVLAAGIFVGKWTAFGRNCYALGGSEQSSGLMGLPVGPTKIAVYALSGFCSALAGVLFTVYTTAGNATAAGGLELDAIAAVVVGGTLLSGGSGSVAGTLFGVLIFGVINTGIQFKGDVNAAWTRITVGLLLLVFILLQKLIQRKGGAR
jgi:ribose/xylose/arabinose/galactoside ABC-type transport system permease subunit